MRRTVTLAIAAVGVVFPKRLLGLNAKINLLGYRNTEDVEPSGWLVQVTRLVCLAIVLWLVVVSDDDAPAGGEDYGIDRIE